MTQSYSIVPVRLNDREIIFARYSKTVITKRQKVWETHVDWALARGLSVHVDERDCAIEPKHGRGIDRFKGWLARNEKPRTGLVRGSALEIAIGFSCMAHARDWARSLTPDMPGVRVLRAVIELERAEAAPSSPSPDTTPEPTQAESTPAEPNSDTSPPAIVGIDDLLPPPWQQAPHEKELARRRQLAAEAPPPTRPAR
jgi:hypothetical protein